MKRQIIGFLLLTALTTISLGMISCASKQTDDRVSEQKGQSKLKKSEKLKQKGQSNLENQQSVSLLRQPDPESAVEFDETWAYVVQGREDGYNQQLPVTDICYFAADLNCYGELIDIPVRSKLTIREDQRIHYVFICDGKSLTHMLLEPQFGIRDKIITKIVETARDFDGLQLDMENIPARDADLFMSFVKDIKKQWDLNGGQNINGGSKMFTICVPARMRRISGEIFPYAELGQLCDRVFVMAYDEHWSTSAPGAIASVDWCRRVVEFAVTQIPQEKLIMGMPFYGRTWVEKNPASAWIFTNINAVVENNEMESFDYENDIPTFKYTAQVPVTGYFNDTWSILSLSKLYKENNIQNIGFWRLGQEDYNIWSWLNGGLLPAPVEVAEISE